jgi:hypothetical protein
VLPPSLKSRDSSVGTDMGYGLYGRGFCVRFPTWAKDNSLLCSVQTESGAHRASYLIDTGVPFPRGKAARV